MIELLAFEEEDFDRFTGWIKNEQEMVQFAGPIFTYPLTRNQLSNYITDTTRMAFKVRLISTSEIIGHCELNLQNEIPRLSRILIGDPAFRNKGLGREIVRSLLNHIFSATDFEVADLNVFSWNQNAIASYKSDSFEFNPEVSTSVEVDGETWVAANMIISKERYLLSEMHSRHRGGEII